jgi:hypothetical protein
VEFSCKRLVRIFLSFMGVAVVVPAAAVCFQGGCRTLHILVKESRDIAGFFSEVD